MAITETIGSISLSIVVFFEASPFLESL